MSLVMPKVPTMFPSSGDAESADDVPFLVAQRHLGRQNPRVWAVGPRLSFLHVQQRLAGSDDPLFVLIRLPGVLIREEVKVRLAYCLRRITQAERLGVSLGGSDKAAFAILEVDIAGNVIHEGFHQRLLAGQRFEQPGVGDGVGQLVGHGLQDGNVLLAEGHLLRGLDGQRADDLATTDERQRQLGAGFGQ